jgi:hypothetical protein
LARVDRYPVRCDARRRPGRGREDERCTVAVGRRGRPPSSAGRAGGALRSAPWPRTPRPRARHAPSTSRDGLSSSWSRAARIPPTAGVSGTSRPTGCRRPRLRGRQPEAASTRTSTSGQPSRIAPRRPGTPRTSGWSTCSCARMGGTLPGRSPLPGGTCHNRQLSPRSRGRAGLPGPARRHPDRVGAIAAAIRPMPRAKTRTDEIVTVL